MQEALLSRVLSLLPMPTTEQINKTDFNIHPCRNMAELAVQVARSLDTSVLWWRNRHQGKATTTESSWPSLPPQALCLQNY